MPKKQHSKDNDYVASIKRFFSRRVKVSYRKYERTVIIAGTLVAMNFTSLSVVIRATDGTLCLVKNIIDIVEVKDEET